MPKISVILPCRDEEKTIGLCIQAVEKAIKKHRLDAEIIVSDSSADYSPYIAKEYNVRVIKHDKKGYGIAIMKGIKAAKGEYIVIGDADGTYDFSELPKLVKKLSEYDLVIGSRMKGNIKKGAMPFMHRYLGNPILSGILNLFFRTNISDAHSGFRAIKKDAYELLDLKTTGMEFASEMIIKAAKNNMNITEVPISYHPREGKSKLKSFSDGWRHLRFMLMFSPTYLFFIPGVIAFILGLLLIILTLNGQFMINNFIINFYISILGSLLSITGSQALSLGLYSRIYAIHTGFEKNDKVIDFIAAKVSLERGLLLGVTAIIACIIGSFSFIGKSLIQPNLSLVFLWLTLFIIALQSIFSAFFISMMLVEKRD